MKKIYLSLLIVCTLILNASGANVTVVMNATSRTMTLTEKSSENQIDVGTPATYTYNFNAAQGTYVLNGFNINGISNGTLEIEITDEATQTFRITTITAYASNSGWVLGTDYTMECQANSREGISRVITTSTTATAGRQTFLMNVGDSYRLSYAVSESRVAEGFLPTFHHSNTVTAAATNAFLSIPKGTVYSLTIPETASIYVGAKLGAVVQSSGGTHYVPFTEIISDSSKVADAKRIYYYTLGQGCVYNFKVSQTGKLTNGGIFTVPATAGSNLEITQADLDTADPKMIDRDVTHNSFANVGDILLNINKQGHINMPTGQKRQLLCMRSWQLTDTQVNNYFIEPDFHYKIVDVNGNEINDVIRINEKNEIEAIGNGTAIVLVTYDAIQLKIYNNTGVASNYMTGPLFTSIWPENTGTFVVSVGQLDGSSIVPNMKVQEKNRVDNSDGMGADLDSEHDVMYYFEGAAGYYYTFKPEGVSSVSVANPVLGTNFSNYNGFTNITTNEDGTYTALLTYGRNIIKMTSASGASVYQVVSAKPAGYVISNKSRPDMPIMPGDDINIQFNGFFHPANKLSGIYNMSAYILYNNIPNGNSLILSPNQYTFGGNPAAQLTQFHVPADWDPSTPFELRNGAIQINGYGSVIGKHRDISVTTGINPNFTAVVRVNYFGSIPDVDVLLSAPVDGFKFTGLPGSAEIIVRNDVNDTIKVNANGEYLGTYRTYSYEIYADGYKAILGINTIVEDDGVKEIPVTMTLIADTQWDGTSMAKPKQVTAEEATVVGSEFENKEGYYKITNAYELRWIAYQAEQKVAGNNVILTEDIDLGNYLWSPIGYNTTYFYSGTFEGNYKTVKGLNINSSTGYPALIGYVLGGKIMNLTTEGNITKAKAAMIGGLAGEFYVENCHNKATVNGGQGTGGLVGNILSVTGNAKIINCSNAGNVNTGSSMYAGGFAGQISGSALIENCWNSGNVTSTNGYVGGFSGSLATATIKNCYNTGHVSAKGTNVGGLVGYAQSGSITNCYNTGTMTNTNTAGYGAIKGAGTAATVTNCYAPDNIGDNIKSDGTIIKLPEAFVSGEVTWLLGTAFGQTISIDTLPVFGGASVYRVIYTNNFDAQVDTLYTNGVLPAIEKTGFTSKWLTGVAGGEINEVSADAELYVQFTQDTTTDTGNIKFEFAVYPNPFTNYLVVKSDRDQMLKIVNISGQSMISTRVNEGVNKIDVSLLPKGSYIVNCGSDMIKIVK